MKVDVFFEEKIMFLFFDLVDIAPLQSPVFSLINVCIVF